MISTAKNRPRFKKLLFIILGLSVLLAAGNIAANYPAGIEKYYSRGLYPVIATITQAVFNIVPFSAGDLLYLFAIVYLITMLVLLVRTLVKRRFAQAGALILKLVIKVQCAILIFYLFWGMNYFRIPAAQRFSFRDSCCTPEEIKQVTRMLIDSANLYRSVLTSSDFRRTNSELFQQAASALKNVSSDKNFRIYSPRVKPSMLTFFMNYMSTAGYYNPFTSEAQLNDQMPLFTRPVIACHEMAHQIGYNAEDEANFAGFIAGVSANDKLLNYSAYYLGVEEFMTELRGRDSVSFNELKPLISDAVRADFKTSREYWMKYRGQVGFLSGILYDNYLKMNNQPQGLKTYNRMVKLVIAWHIKNKRFTQRVLPVAAGGRN